VGLYQQQLEEEKVDHQVKKDDARPLEVVQASRYQYYALST
jgi:hypothetical protein